MTCMKYARKREKKKEKRREKEERWCVKADAATCEDEKRMKKGRKMGNG